MARDKTAKQIVKEKEAVDYIRSRAHTRKITDIVVTKSFIQGSSWVVKLRVYSEGAKRPSYKRVYLPLD